MTLRDKILVAALGAIAEFATDTARAINANGTPTTDTTPQPDDDTSQEPCDAPSVTSRTWRTAFASDIQATDLIAIEGRHYGGPPGRRALRVTARRDGEHQHNPFAPPSPSITFLFVDLDTGKSDHVTAGPDSAIEVAVEVPDSVPADMETGR